MRYLSVCSGIEAATVAWHPLGWTPFAFAETEAFPAAVIRHHYPHVPNLGDMNAWREWPDAAIEVTRALQVGGGKPGQGYVGVRQGWAVRRLTPLECERLQGFPDGYTAVPYRGKPAADGPRYKALGNSMAVNCMRWLGRRIEMVERHTASLTGTGKAIR